MAVAMVDDEVVLRYIAGQQPFLGEEDNDMAKQKPAQQVVSPRLTQKELHSLLDEARKDYERVATFGGDKVGATLSLLLIDLLSEMKEQNAQVREVLALTGKQ